MGTGLNSSRLERVDGPLPGGDDHGDRARSSRSTPAEVTAVGGREGHVRSADGTAGRRPRPPVEMGGPGGATNPEELFAAGYAACFQSALQVVASRSKVSVEGSTVAAKVTIGTIGGGGFGLAVALDVHVPELDAATVEELIAGAHEVCPYSNATRGNIEVHARRRS